jgi:hypothetical protein
MPVNQVVGVIAVRDRFMSATRPVFVLLVVLAAIVPWRAVCRIHGAHLDLVLLDAALAHVVQVAVVQVIGVLGVLDGLVAAIGAMLVGVVLVGRHVQSPSWEAAARFASQRAIRHWRQWK